MYCLCAFVIGTLYRYLSLLRYKSEHPPVLLEMFYGGDDYYHINNKNADEAGMTCSVSHK